MNWATLKTEQDELRQRIRELERQLPESRKDVREVQRYTRELTVEDEEARLNRVLCYQRQHSNLSFEDACNELGEFFSIGSTTLNPSGQVDSSYYYARMEDAPTEAGMAAMLAACRADGFSEAQIERFKHLVEQGMDHSRAYATAAVWDPNPDDRARREGRPNPFESKVTPARSLEVAGMSSGGAGGEGYYTPTDPWGPPVGPPVSAPPVRGSTAAFLPLRRPVTRASAGPPIGIPRPEPGAKPGLPAIYELEDRVEHYVRMGVPLAQAKDLAAGITHE